jgi:hypothetical protein
LIVEDYILIEAKVKPLVAAELLRDAWLVILHTKRIPPHVGILTNGNYNSLTIKGHELNISVEALLKTISQRKIESVFVKLLPHPVFSAYYQLEVFQEMIKQFPMVKQNEATCLSPVKLFLEEFYALTIDKSELLFQLVNRLSENNYIKQVSAINIALPENGFELPLYTPSHLQKRIQQEREAFYKN